MYHADPAEFVSFCTAFVWANLFGYEAWSLITSEIPHMYIYIYYVYMCVCVYSDCVVSFLKHAGSSNFHLLTYELLLLNPVPRCVDRPSMQTLGVPTLGCQHANVSSSCVDRPYFSKTNQWFSLLATSAQ